MKISLKQTLLASVVAVTTGAQAEVNPELPELVLQLGDVEAHVLE